MSAGLAGGMLATLFGAWGAVWLLNRWRSGPRAARPGAESGTR
jgi:hypothetical protein